MCACPVGEYVVLCLRDLRIRRLRLSILSVRWWTGLEGPTLCYAMLAWQRRKWLLRWQRRWLLLLLALLTLIILSTMAHAQSREASTCYGQAVTYVKASRRAYTPNMVTGSSSQPHPGSIYILTILAILGLILGLILNILGLSLPILAISDLFLSILGYAAKPKTIHQKQSPFKLGLAECA